MDKKRKEIIFSLLFLGVLVFAGLNSCLYSFRIDATSTGMFSISDVSRDLFKQIPEQVRITYYLTGKLVETNPVYSQIEDILRAYADSSRGKIRLDVVDPVRDNRQREVDEYGIQQFPSGRQTSEQEASLIPNASSGIVIQYLDRSRVFPVIQSTDTLEYDLSSMIRSLVSNRTKKIGYLVDTQDFDYQAFSEIFVSQLRGYMDLQEVRKGDDVPQTLDALIVFGGADLTEFELFPVDRYVMRGGRVIFSSAAIRIVQNPQFGVIGSPVENSPLLSLLKTYGVTVSPELVLESRDFALPIGDGTRYNYFFTTYEDFVSRDNPVTRRMRPIFFFWASPLTVSPPSTVRAETLVSTSPRAAAQKDAQGQGLNLAPQQAGLMYQMLASEHSQSYPLVVALNGEFPSYFRDKDVPVKEGVKNDWTKSAPSSVSTRIIVVGDDDAFSPGYISRGAVNNRDFFIICLDWLTNDEDLLAIRTRAARDTLMVKIQDPDARKTAVTVIIIVNLAVLPLLVIGAGVLNFFLRRRTRKADR